jgi:hypothetical protein
MGGRIINWRQLEKATRNGRGEVGPTSLAIANGPLLCFAPPDSPAPLCVTRTHTHSSGRHSSPILSLACQVSASACSRVKLNQTGC